MILSIVPVAVPILSGSMASSFIELALCFLNQAIFLTMMDLSLLHMLSSTFTIQMLHWHIV